MRERLKAWLKQLREVAYEIEDVMDEYLLHVTKHHYHRHGIFLSFLRKISHQIKALNLSYSITYQIQNIQTSLRELKDRGETYGLRPFDQQGVISRGMKNVEQHHDPRLAALFVEENELVGIDIKRDVLVRKLVRGESTRIVISLIGQGGVGKTTLAKKVYDSKEVKARFNFHAWISVSQSYNIEKILKSIAMQICPAAITESIAGDMDTLPKLISILRQSLVTKRYVIVFYDIWDINFWKVMKLAFPNNDEGSRIVITTRNDEVASSNKETPCDFVLKIQPLSQELSWELFCKKAFCFEFETRCPRELEELPLKIVKKCQGLPLVITTVDYAIEYFTLCRLWIAEGFVLKQRDKTLVQVAEEYLNDLINRNLVQTWVNFYVSTKSCQVHDLMHEIILSRVNEFGFCKSLGHHQHNSRSREKYRHLSIYHTTKNVLQNVEDLRGVRSVFLFNIDKLEVINVDLIKKFKPLKVLDVSNAPLCHLPEEMGNSLHLKYLSLRNNKQIKMLPKSIGKLYNLQILDIRGTCILDLPIEINKLWNLQHILAFCHDLKLAETSKALQGVKIHKGFGCLEELQTLLVVDAYQSGIGAIKELEKMKKLKALGISELSAETGKTLCSSIEKMNHLNLLGFHSINEEEILDVQHISSPPCFLTQLYLIGKLQKLPKWIKKVQNLPILKLYHSRLTNDPLKLLEHLPNLEFLDMHRAYEGEELHFQEGSFRKLKHLALEKLDGLKVLKIDKGALPVLENLFLGPHPLMKEVPPDIKHLEKLEFLKAYDMPKEFLEIRRVTNLVIQNCCNVCKDEDGDAYGYRALDLCSMK
nr:disease resistance protein RPM1-like [Ziziphus jujuba var. spinosa]